MLIAVIASISVTVSAGTRISKSELPQTVIAFLNKHFPGDEVRKAEKETGFSGTEYEVDLVSGAEIDFKGDGSWKEVKAARGAAVPPAIVPAAIRDFVSANFSGQQIVEIQLKRGGYEVELSNGSELKLTVDGKPMQRGNRR